MRLVPIESVAAVVEVKLQLTKAELRKAERAASETARPRYRVTGDIPTGAVGRYRLQFGREASRNPTTYQLEHRLAVSATDIAINRPTFAVFAFGGVTAPEPLADWLRDWGARQSPAATCLGTVNQYCARPSSFPCPRQWDVGIWCAQAPAGLWSTTTCDSNRAIFSQGIDTGTYFVYDAAGNLFEILEGFASSQTDGLVCLAGPPTYVQPQCAPNTAPSCIDGSAGDAAFDARAGD
jgi:hypothetical protein